MLVMHDAQLLNPIQSEVSSLTSVQTGVSVHGIRVGYRVLQVQ